VKYREVNGQLNIPTLNASTTMCPNAKGCCRFKISEGEKARLPATRPNAKGRCQFKISENKKARPPALNTLPRQYHFMMTKGGCAEMTSALGKEAVKIEF
jgi:hypothetical protein